MLFNSFDFALFLPIVFLLYWFVFQKNLKIQNAFLLIVSYIFYGWWDWRFLSLIIFSSFVDFFIGKMLKTEEKEKKRKLLLFTSVFINLGFLGVFKYFNFFIDSFIDAFQMFGVTLQGYSLNIILPVGISFYTFQTLSYSIDVYRKKLEPTNDIISFFAFVSFFPQLVAGPIERASNLLPQFYKKRKFNYANAVDGTKQILWGLFKKMVIADNAAIYVNDIFAHSDTYPGSMLAIGIFLFAVQIYGDFSGYSDIAIGVSRLFGFNLMQNFAFPYFSRNIGEFWRRWHISLSTWFRDYLYIPLGGSRGGTWMKIRNTFVIFIVSGFWHGANWTFIIWGALNAIYFLPLLLSNKNRNFLDTVAAKRFFPSIKETVQIAITFILTLFAWVFFRAENLDHAFSYISQMMSISLFTKPIIFPTTTLALVAFFILVEWINRKQQFGFVNIPENKILRISWYIFIAILIFAFGIFEKTEFIYFAF